VTAAVELGDAVMVENIASRNVAGRAVLSRWATRGCHPYVMECGYATSSVLPAAEGLDRCARCWKGPA